MKKSMKPTATLPSANAIGVPENISSKVAPPKSRPMVSSLMALCREACDELQQQLQRQQGHAGGHQPVGDRQRRRPRRRGGLLVDPGLVPQGPRLPREEDAEG